MTEPINSEVKIKLKRKARLEGDQAIIESEITEYLDKTGYERLFTKKNSDLQALDFAMRDAKNRLEQLAITEKEVAQLKGQQKEIYEMVSLALNIKESDELKKKLQEMEVVFIRLKDEVKSLREVYAKLVK